MRSLIFLATAVALHLPPAILAGPITAGGVVRADGGAPLAEAQVELLPLVSNHDQARMVLAGRAAAEPVATTRSDASGRFSIAVPEAGVRTLVARRAGFVPMRFSPLPLASPTELPPVTLLGDEGMEIAIVDPSGNPRAGIWVYAESASESTWEAVAKNGWRVGARIGRSDQDGRLSLPRAPNERLTITAFAPRSLAFSRSEGGATATLVLREKSGFRRVVEIRDEEGKPIPDVVVAAGDPAWPVGMTGADGRLDLDGRPADPVALHLFAADGRRQRTELEPFASGDEGPTQFVLAPPALVRGRIIAAADRRPLAAALVWPAHDPGTFVLTDAQGTYQLTAPPGDRFSVQGEAPGFLPQARRVGAEDRGTGRGTTLALTAAAAASGQVVDGTGKPVPGVVLEATVLPPARHRPAYHPDHADSRSVSDAGGRFTLHRLDPAASHELRAMKEGFATSKVTFGGHGAAPLRIVLERVRPAHGRVVDGQEGPLGGAEVTVFATGSPASRRDEPITAWTDAAGRFDLASLPGPKVDLRAGKKGFAPLTVPGVEVPPGTGPIDLGTLILVPGVAVSGRITDLDDEPIAKAGVWVMDGHSRPRRSQSDEIRQEQPAAVSGPDGRFRVEDLEPGRRVHLLVAGDDYLPSWIAGLETPHPEPLVVMLEPAASISGQVVDQDRRPVSGARVRLHGQAPPPGTVGVALPRGKLAKSVATDRRGNFVISDLPPGPAVIEVTAHGFQPPEPREIKIPPGGSLADLILVVAPGAVVEGLVSTREGEPIAGVRVNVEGSATTSDGDGIYRLEGVPLGQQTLWARHPEFELRLHKVEISPGVNVVDLVLRAGFPVNGRVVDEEGTPVADVRVELRREGGGESRRYEATSGADGHFNFPGVVKGNYQVEADKDGYASAPSWRGLEVAGGPVDDLEVVLTTGAAVVGRLLGVKLEDLATAEVEAERDEETVRTGTVDYQGRYEVKDLGPGVWLLRARIRGGSREAEARVMIAPGGGQLSQDLEFGTGITLSGHVSYGGEPLPETTVSLRGHDLAVERSVTTDHQGNFRMADLKAGRYRLGVASHREQLLHNEDLELHGDREVHVEIATARVSGRVSSATTSLPLADAMVYCQQLLGDGQQPGPLVTVGTDQEGGFILARLSAGRHRLTVRKPGYAPHEQVIDLAAGVAPEGLELELGPTEGLDAVIRLASGRAPESATVIVLEASGRVLLSETHGLAGAGNVRFATVPPGTWELIVSAPEAAVARVTATVPGPPLEIVLSAGARLIVRAPALVESNRVATLTVLGEDGLPFQGLDAIGTLRQEWPLSGGTGVVEGVPAGGWILRAVASDGQILQGTAIITGGGEYEVVLK